MCNFPKEIKTRPLFKKNLTLCIRKFLKGDLIFIECLMLVFEIWFKMGQLSSLLLSVCAWKKAVGLIVWRLEFLVPACCWRAWAVYFRFAGPQFPCLPETKAVERSDLSFSFRLWHCTVPWIDFIVILPLSSPKTFASVKHHLLLFDFVRFCI